MLGTPNHFNGTVGTSNTTVSLGKTMFWLDINNTHALNSLYISFDGTNFYTITYGENLALPCSVNSITIKGSDTGTTYEIIGVN